MKVTPYWKQQLANTKTKEKNHNNEQTEVGKENKNEKITHPSWQVLSDAREEQKNKRKTDWIMLLYVPYRIFAVDLGTTYGNVGKQEDAHTCISGSSILVRRNRCSDLL